MSDHKEYIFNKSDDGKTANILIDGEISAWWGVGLKDLAKDIANSGADNVMLQINSGGGSVFEGMAIAAFIKGSPTNISTSIMGLAASIATPIALAGESTSISKGSMFMIHNASAFVGGEAEDLEKTAALLKKIDKQLVSVYVDAIARNGKLIEDSRKKTEEQVAKWQNEETWFTAEEAVEYGFIQNLTEGGEFLNKTSAKDIYNSCGRFNNVPAAFLNKVKTIANMSETTDKKKAEGLFNKFLAFFKENPDVLKEDEPTNQEPSKEEKIAAAKALLAENGVEVNEPTNEADDLKAQLEAEKQAREAAEAKALKLEEEKNGAPVAGATVTDTSKKEETSIETVLAKHSDELEAMAKMMK